MNAETRRKIFDKNEKLINMVIERAKRDFADDIAIIGLTGSFSTGDFHEKSDLDLIIINNTDRGWGIASCFILEDVGYDIYCTPWEAIEDKANLGSEMISHLIDLQIIYCAKPEYLEKFNSYKQKALDSIAKPIGKECLTRAEKYIDKAKQEYTNALLSVDIGAVRNASCKVLYNLLNALTNLNNTYLHRGIKRYLEEITSYRYIPDDLEKLYMAVIDAKTIEEIRSASYEFLKSINDLYHKMYQDFIIQPVPVYDNLRGTYEELWCNYRNKVIISTGLGDKSYAYHVAMGVQNYLDEMTEMVGTKKFDLLRYFDADNLGILEEQFMKIMDEYLEEYNRVGRKVKRYDTFEQLCNQYLNG
ncbi:nucleotidyltransferase domain-containing protein [Anaerocolumna xylanovorans]|uniref:Nucleotidyltransferase domain-containing protein n=1 Tax=Anaerocolumna xylanovorans DSM 12503 TaxID=1121345 RepID=A0A1M7Y6U3_9FIRM|nr:nucleotidyltransferase domain-containing protein [Anaerocolumna xylanovorans]SHO48349.1 Nucleotidyltransferase domain-containing protein [Anaerocolumna xylanovorans DSM 12503]